MNKKIPFVVAALSLAISVGCQEAGSDGDDDGNILSDIVGSVDDDTQDDLVSGFL